MSIHERVTGAWIHEQALLDDTRILQLSSAYPPMGGTGSSMLLERLTNEGGSVCGAVPVSVELGTPTVNTIAAFTQSALTLEVADVSPLFQPTVITLYTEPVCLGTMVDDVASSALTGVYPNPVSDLLYFDRLLPGAANAEVLDICGKRALPERCARNGSIDVSSLSKGIYFLRVTDGLGRSTVEARFVRE